MRQREEMGQSPHSSHRSSLGGSAGPDNEDSEADKGTKMHKETEYISRREMPSMDSLHDGER